MEIRTDVSRPAEQPLKTVHQNQTRPAVENESQPGRQNTSRRDFLNAMNLMQTASGLILEALNASSHLRSIARSTMVIGGADFTEVTKALAGIQSSLQQYGQPVMAPVIHDTELRRTSVPDIRNEIDQLGAMAHEKKIDPELLDKIEKSLFAAEKAVEKNIVSFQKENGIKKYDAAKFDSFVKNLPANHLQALAAQGNILHDNAAALLS